MKLLARLCQRSPVPVYFVSCGIFTFHKCFVLVSGQLTILAELRSHTEPVHLLLYQGLCKLVGCAEILNELPCTFS